MSGTRLIRAAKSLLCGMAMVLGATAAQAHHSFAAQYDAKKPIKMTGVVTRMEWTNPHVYVYVDVKDPKTRKVTNWGFEMGPPHMLQKTGWKRNSLTTGETVDMEGWLARDGSNTANARRVTRKSTGEVLGAASTNSQTLAGNQGTKSPATP
jgi:Family of unknown function (DUF6152)